MNINRTLPFKRLHLAGIGLRGGSVYITLSVISSWVVSSHQLAAVPTHHAPALDSHDSLSSERSPQIFQLIQSARRAGDIPFRYFSFYPYAAANGIVSHTHT